MTIVIRGGVPDPLKPLLKKNIFVCWINEDDRDYWIKFLGSAWPFKGPTETIFVDALAPSGWYKVASKVEKGSKKSHKYAVKKDPDAPDPPPDGPDVIVEGS